MHVAFAQARPGNADEFRLAVHLHKIFGAHVTHGGAQSAGKLVENGCRRTFIRNLTFDALGNQLECVLDVLLEITVRRAA